MTPDIVKTVSWISSETGEKEDIIISGLHGAQPAPLAGYRSIVRLEINGDRLPLYKSEALALGKALIAVARHLDAIDNANALVNK